MQVSYFYSHSQILAEFNGLTSHSRKQ